MQKIALLLALMVCLSGCDSQVRDKIKDMIGASKKPSATVAAEVPLLLQNNRYG
jgi:uncharacterized protein YceK